MRGISEKLIMNSAYQLRKIDQLKYQAIWPLYCFHLKTCKIWKSSPSTLLIPIRAIAAISTEAYLLTLKNFSTSRSDSASFFQLSRVPLGN